VRIDNDAVTAAYGDARLGAGRGVGDVLVVTLGTGVGVAMLTNGQPLRTAAGTHPEAGHLWVPGDAPCYCGRASCWEQHASRSALQVGAARLGLDLDEAHSRARQGEPAARALFEGYGRAVAHGLADLVTLLGPERVVLGGGGARFLETFRPALEETIGHVTGCFGQVPVVAAELGDLAGAIGAALWAASTSDC